MEILKRLMLIAILAIGVWLGFDARTGSKLKSKKFLILVGLLIILLIFYVVVFNIPVHL